jgi:hypothetical protein
MVSDFLHGYEASAAPGIVARKSPAVVGRGRAAEELTAVGWTISRGTSLSTGADPSRLAFFLR